MKKLIYLLPILFIASCSPAFGGGGWIAVALPAAGCALTGIAAYKGQGKTTKLGWTIFSIVLGIAAIVIFFIMKADV